MYKKIPVSYLFIIFLLATVLIYFNFVILGATLLAAVGLATTTGSIRREMVRERDSKKRERDYIGYEKFARDNRYIPIVSDRGNVYDVYRLNPDATLDAI